MPFFDINWNEFLSFLLKVAIAFAAALPVGWDRERSTRNMGLRTFPLVAVASCSYILLASRELGNDPAPQARVLQALMTGMGFIGGGAILKKGDNVTGTATAASIWTTGAIGAAVAYDQYEMAIVISLINFAAFRFLTPLKEQLQEGEERSSDD